MIRKHEKTVAFRAGLMTLLVHGVLLVVLFFSIHWKSVQPMQIATVELWDNLTPPAPTPIVKPTPQPEIKPEPKPEVKPEPEVEVKKEPEPPVKVDIQVKKNPPKPEVKQDAKKKPEPAKTEPVKPDTKSDEELNKLKEELLKEDTQLTKQTKPKSSSPAELKANQAVQGATEASEIAKYVSLITAQIKENVNPQVCGKGKPELMFEIHLRPDGYLVDDNPKLLSSNASPACNDAVTRAIIESQKTKPLPVPKQPDLFNQFRSLKLKFRPNDEYFL